MASVSPLRANVVANFAGRMWSGLVGLLFIPLYLKFLGIEAYGLIGIFASLMALISILDLGLGTTLNRQLAAYSTMAGKEQQARDLVRTLEVLYWGAGIAIGAGLTLLAPLIAQRWLNVDRNLVPTVERAVQIMGLIVACQWPSSLYYGGLMGLQRQVLLNAIQSVVATVQAGGAVLVLWLVSPTIQAYFTWQILIGLAQTAILARFLWRSLPEGAAAPRFRKTLFLENWKFAAGMTGISAASVALTQLDKVILSKILSLEMFGYYVLAFNVASAMSFLVSPVFSALFPRFAQQVAAEETADQISLYHKGCQLVSVLVLPVASTLGLFAPEVLTLWLKNPTTVSHTSYLLSLILIGTSLNSVMVLPLALQLAYGWTRLSFYKNVIALILFIPAATIMITRYGATGAAIVWILLNAGYCLIEVPIMHGRLLKGELWRWYGIDVGLPLLVALGTVWASRMIMPGASSPLFTLSWISSTLAIAFLLSGLVSPAVREWMRQEVVQ